MVLFSFFFIVFTFWFAPCVCLFRGCFCVFCLQLSLRFDSSLLLRCFLRVSCKSFVVSALLFAVVSAFSRSCFCVFPPPFLLFLLFVVIVFAFARRCPSFISSLFLRFSLLCLSGPSSLFSHLFLRVRFCVICSLFLPFLFAVVSLFFVVGVDAFFLRFVFSLLFLCLFIVVSLLCSKEFEFASSSSVAVCFAHRRVNL